MRSNHGIPPPMISSLTFWSSFRTSSRISCGADGKKAIRCELRSPTSPSPKELLPGELGASREESLSLLLLIHLRGGVPGPGPRVAIQPGFPSSQAERSLNGGLETWLDCSPHGTGFHISVSPHFTSKEEGCSLHFSLRHSPVIAPSQESKVLL